MLTTGETICETLESCACEDSYATGICLTILPAYHTYLPMASLQRRHLVLDNDDCNNPGSFAPHLPTSTPWYAPFLDNTPLGLHRYTPVSYPAPCSYHDGGLNRSWVVLCWEEPQHN